MKQILNKIMSKFKVEVTCERDKAPIEVSISQMVQRQIFLSYTDTSGNNKLPTFRDAGFRVHSQADEDGLLLYIFSQIGFTNRKLVDFACGKPNGANSTNLILNWGFHGLLTDGSDENILECKNLYHRHPDTILFPPRIVKAWITAENINDLIRDNGFLGEIDLLSLDVDGVDYWLWKRLEIVSPRVVILEYQDCFADNMAVTVPYSANFNRHDYHPDYFGASLAAFAKLGREKGYRLVGCNRYGYNALFIRNDISSEFLPEIAIKECLVHAKIVESREQRRDTLSKFTWLEI